jgi:hypothetical protein
VDFSQAPLPYSDNFFDLVLDKSTLDCTLCSDNATASLLLQVYRCLAIGGVYMLISFHELELLLPLLADLPGAAWEVTCTTLQRQVESLVVGSRATTSATPSCPSTAHTTPNNNSKHLNVLIARKRQSTAQLNFDAVRQHVHKVNDSWFQKQQPLLTRIRAQELAHAFVSPQTLPQAYQVLFTNAEREHLTYEHFLEDWKAFSQRPSNNNIAKDAICCEVALAFLKEMQ